MSINNYITLAADKILLKTEYLPNADSADLQTIVSVVLTIVGAIAVFVVVFAGIQMVISAGNTEKVATARKALLAAIAGIVIIFSAQLIVNFVWDKI